MFVQQDSRNLSCPLCNRDFSQWISVSMPFKWDINVKCIVSPESSGSKIGFFFSMSCFNHCMQYKPHKQEMITYNYD